MMRRNRIFTDFLRKILKHILRDNRVEEFIQFNKSRLKKKRNKNSRVVLIELGTNFTGTLALSYFTKYWHDRNFKVIGYLPAIYKSYFSILMHTILAKTSIDNGIHFPYRIARSIGVERFLIIRHRMKKFRLSKPQSKDFNKLSKKDVLFYEIDGIRVGDLFYDWHLRKRDLVTLDTKNNFALEDWRLFLEYLAYWIKTLDSKNVSTIVVSHSVYLQGIPARVALSRGIQVLLISYDRVFRLNNDLIHSDLEYKLYDPNLTFQIGYEIDLERAKSSWLSDKFIFDYNLKIPGLVSGFNGSEKLVLNQTSKKPKVLIAPHCFNDAPHSLGDFLFNDYWEWLIYVCESSRNLDYEWYIKPHPAFSVTEHNILDQILENYPYIKLIDSSVSNKSIFTQGLDAVITVQGSIGFEAAMFGILSLCCSKNIPTQNYNFSICAGSLSEFDRLLETISLLKSKISYDKDKLLHFYDLHILRKEKTWLFKDKSAQYFSKFGNYFEIFQSPAVFDIWLSEFYSDELDHNRSTEVQKFLDSTNYLFEIDLTSI